MKRKSIEIPCKYVLDSITLIEVMDCFKDVMDRLNSNELPPIYSRKGFSEICCNPKDAQQLAYLNNGAVIRLHSRHGDAIFEIKMEHSILPNEILFN